MVDPMREFNINYLVKYFTVSVLAIAGLSLSLALGAELKEQKPEPELLKDPKSPGMNKQAPAKYQVKFVTSKGDFVI